MSAASIFVLGLALVLVLPIAKRVYLRRFDPFEPIVLFSLAYAAMFVVRPASMLAHGDLGYMAVDIRGTLPRALLLGLGGGVAFVCGYELRAGRALARSLPTPREIPTRTGVGGSTILIALAFIALVVMLWPSGGLRGVTILLGGRSQRFAQLDQGVSSYVSTAVMLVVPAALILLMLAVRDRRPRLVIPAALVFAFALVITIPLGSRIFLLPLVGGAVTFAYISRGARPRPLTLVAFAMLALVASYMLLVVRQPGERTRLGPFLHDLADHPGYAFYPILHGHDAEMAPVMAAALRVIPSRLHYRYGGVVIGDLVTRPIPRQLWAGKPQPVEQQLVGTIWPRLAKYANPAFSPLLFFYWDFGVPGVLAGMALFGIGCCALFEWFLRHRDNLAAQLIFASAVWYVVVGVRNDPVDSIVLASFVVLPLVLLERFSALQRPIVRPILARARLSQR